LVVVALLAGWVTWKVYKLSLMTQYGPFSWEYWRPTLILTALIAAGWVVVTLLRPGDTE
jgi:hypothetical protein